ncbi:DUF4843 domain-containing protein [Pseudobacter ginsenosidimutans]|jgi:hypothetical protein|uniref:Uncharacterized protein DUF4843 n=1 Tax=Pseudobacter ginsenosidimutans TaxID=661488 RepID=A0A4V2F1V2_9BACT|nr:DUF4843 domain-containing protein [Pseudobacter ginsenosidimutans]QEC43665.1 DUF4843 domain-containing protein [Pseudobacter ginsenosidimutans]RZS75066.1 uncharacterized protein DUF4843 [Pseudobacter ginsenosidimutans]
MKLIQYLLIPCCILALFSSCKKDEIELYKGDEYIQFSKNYTDSSAFSFLALPDEDEGAMPLTVELIGKPVDKDRQYKITVVKEASTAEEGNYALPSGFTLPANSIADTAWITIKKTPAISVKPLRLVLRITPTDDFRQGQTDYSIAIINISNVIAQPGWWKERVEWYFLGDYSNKKYQLFIQVTGKVDLNPANEPELRNYTILFKNYLLMEKDAGRTVYEEDGSEMTVALIGG